MGGTRDGRDGRRGGADAAAKLQWQPARVSDEQLKNEHVREAPPAIVARIEGAIDTLAGYW